jgi:hypothetical protein
MWNKADWLVQLSVQQLWQRKALVDCMATMCSESLCQVIRSWVDVGIFHTRLFIIFMIVTASVQNILDVPWYYIFHVC